MSDFDALLIRGLAMTKKQKDQNTVELESAYGAWLRALQSALGGTRAAIYNELRKRLIFGKPIGSHARVQAEQLTSDIVRNWLNPNRYTLPLIDPPQILEELIALIADNVKKPPKENFRGFTFPEVVAELRRIRNQNQKAGKACIVALG